jgi:hypothetical protein
MRLAARLPDGSTLRQHLQAAGATDPRLTAMPPAGCDGIWRAFCDLNAARPVGMGAGAVPPSEIDAWQRLHGVRLSPWEVETLMLMDRAALAVMAEKK